MENNKIGMLVEVAKLYYEQDLGQSDIAKQLHLSRPYVSKLLKQAKDMGIVQIRVVDPMNMHSPLEQALMDKYHLEDVTIVSSSDESQILSKITEAASSYLDNIVHDGDVIASSWGQTLYSLSKNLHSRHDLSNVKYVQLCGGVSSVNSAVHSNEIASSFAYFYNADAYLLQAPAIVTSCALKEMLTEEKNISDVLELGKQADVAIMTVGSFGEENALVQAGYLTKEQMNLLVAKGAVGDICSHVINRHGEICDEELDQRTLSVSLEDIKKIHYRIGIAEGTNKIDSIKASLKSGVMNVLFTSVETAKELL